ncbi:hypothetical protein [Balneola vulgaris]|uniref:hypothetical protein n=1 Tax=Balneola vulgaris TaxID=287535 RepID=UPI00037DE9B1|nr:hypothetical protein [Balneola vulgaris]
MRNFREDKDYSVINGPFKIKASSRNGHTATIDLKVNGNLIRTVLPGHDLEEELGTIAELFEGQEEVKVYVRSLVNNVAAHPKSLITITIENNGDTQEFIHDEPFQDEDGEVHDLIRYKNYFNLVRS